jgi:NAD(P)-dependent dehydrogenase (short-subunit alcohol dehydrogenase family)
MIAVVTGANRGLGLEVSRQLARKGYQVVLTARDGAAARAAAESLKGDGSVVAEQLDVANAESVSAFADRLGKKHERIDALVNNAAIAMKGFDGEVVRGTLAVNFFGPLQVTRALQPLVAPGGNVVMVSSEQGELWPYSESIKRRFLDPLLSVDGLIALLGDFASAVATGQHEQLGWPSSAYRVSKAALNSLVRIYDRDVSGVRCNAVCPGWVRTDMGGPGASRSVEQGAAGIVWAATLSDGAPHGGFFRDAKPISW